MKGNVRALLRAKRIEEGRRGGDDNLRLSIRSGLLHSVRIIRCYPSGDAVCAGRELRREKHKGVHSFLHQRSTGCVRTSFSMVPGRDDHEQVQTPATAMAVASIEVFTEIVSLKRSRTRLRRGESRPSSMKAGNACWLV